MEKDKKASEKRILEKTLEQLYIEKRAPAKGFFVLLIIYLACTFGVSFVAKSQSSVNINGIDISIYTFAGVISSIANIVAILLTVYYGKKGFFTALTVLLLQLPMIFMGIFLRKTYTSIPGVFGNLAAIIAIIVIFINNIRIDKYQTKLREQAVTDMLTGLPNRFACSELVMDFIKRGTPFAAVSVNLNGFKGINDTMGFDVGNAVLIEVASRWKSIADNGSSGTLDFICRLSGDEFAIVIRHYLTEDDILKTINLYASALKDKIEVHDYSISMSASFGYAEFPSDTKDVDELFTYANIAMLKAKENAGLQQVMRFSNAMMDNLYTAELESKIRAAIENDTIFYNLQPQFNMEHKLRGFEALARMKDNDGSFISPGEFIPVAESIGIIDKIDSSVFRKSARFIGNLIKETGADIMLSINVSVKHMMRADFLDELITIMDESGIKPENLEIEITESIMIESMDKAFECIEAIKKMGIQIAIDDFGTGYSSLSYLNSFPANLLKIDKSFIDKMNSSDSSKQYVAALISLGHIMGIDVISEGVEQQDQLDTLKAIGCDYVQGFIWGRPLSPEDARKVVLDSFISPVP
ncbi:putative bifunctional diguanylate cyclase/phosphodiesterase [Butyrivibrio sp. NC2007]|uniref:putative bifunctional diguanylate cyclase/phosphodiesterase n=1 Tax=Butyrivibrio sp. NC2007 TaxID=1280683 RepID=UPI0003B39FE7|nr:bifunctional diguanylate cyclase/phosphodiesterase [Butyrivibrio sp. NC2007]